MYFPYSQQLNCVEQTEYTQNQIDKISESVEDRQSRVVW